MLNKTCLRRVSIDRWPGKGAQSVRIARDGGYDKPETITTGFEELDGIGDEIQIFRNSAYNDINTVAKGKSE